MGRLARSSGVVMGTTCWTQSLWFGVSRYPPVPMYPPSENCINPESRASEVVSFIWSRVTPVPCRRSGSTWTWSILIRSPQMETLATPGTSSRRGLIFQYEVIERSITEYCSEESPIFMTRLVDDKGCMMKGGVAQVGRVGYTLARRSDTSCPPWIRSVPGSKG